MERFIRTRRLLGEERFSLLQSRLVTVVGLGAVGGYVVEGHVPAADVRRMLTEKPAIAGISAPGMPMGSPGMEGPYPADRYDVVSFDAQGRTAVYASH